MIFNYDAITSTGEKKRGVVDATTKDLAISAVQKRGLIVVSIVEDSGAKGFLNLSFLEKGVSMKDVVIMSRQISTLFEAQVSALKAFNLLATNTENGVLVKILNQVAEDLQSGTSISTALSKHPKVFSDFYVNMVKAGEESGKLNQVFAYLADYLDRQYQLTAKTKNALIYPAFVMGVFFLVMIMMMVFIVPKLEGMILDSGQAIPVSTQIIFWLSDNTIKYGIYALVAILAFAAYVYRILRTDAGKLYMDNLKIQIPVMRNIYIKLYLSRIADNMDTMLSAGISIIRAIELTSSVVENRVFENILKDATESVKGGSSFSDALGKHKEIPPIMAGMIRVGEETGSMGSILKTLGHFYNREVNDAVDTMVSLIEPIMIVALGLGVGLLLTSILGPIYNIAGGIN